ncbi:MULTISPECIES: peptidoglycan D,D-transpeptidase FtsI family protein [Rhizobium/Agrobacterium group]|uniref:Penicillin-binding protein 2 n=2 Tax=Rhizobium/Agrobacterium group TaxID=227290 RepID=A0AA92C6A1_RHIRH|nr:MULTISPECIES: penicillin-binding protein 2 [Rhizobium/Agrobacterium group]KQM33783.1 cell division protein [Rhizobium sp. Leaf202]KQN85742.1 cell division protein [Rhizobium sp. Leaf68]KQR33544.1 cell division protein [Rhizobium sp. Leaf155]KQZ95664.1 cell division protein [Rhizobium sp. Root564]MDP9572305.1 cell division protein FtsI (penicillin-binding protein 3) [Agrobacterium larrymoorei]MQB21733.1 penicillin-binding protein 2 [Agrobacterium tumefaciens]PVE78506.1 penicillin-binding p
MSFLSRVMVLKSKAHFSASTIGGADHAAFEGARKKRASQAKSRVGLLIFGFVCFYGVIGGRLVQYGLAQQETVSSIAPADRLMASRPDLLDRNGEVLATDIRTVSLFAEPHRIVDVDEAIEKLRTVLPDLDTRGTYQKLTNNSRFQWLRRQLTPKQQSQILALGIPGIGFRPEKRRFYPGGPTAAHVVGHVNIDNRGVAGMERYLDSQGLADLTALGMTSDQPLEPVKLSIDLRVQAIVREVVVNAIQKFQAIGAGAVVINVHTGEILAMASLPDYDPNNPAEGAKEGWLNRMSNGTFEMGSTFKSFTIAMGLDEGGISLGSTFDARFPIRIGGFTIKDFHGKGRILSVPEIFQYSSNIGTAKIADTVGTEGHKEFLTRLGLLSRMQTELPEVAMPTQPRQWKKINSITISFGHGVSTTPLQTAIAGAALVNGGKLIEPTFLPRTVEQADLVAKQVIKPTTSRDMRFLFEWNGVNGSGRNARVEGFNVGGKTGTADKVVNGRYVHDKNFNAFLSAFPMDKPEYVVLSFIDEPKTDKGNGAALAGTSAAPMVHDIITRSAAILGVKPKFGKDGSALLVSY